MEMQLLDSNNNKGIKGLETAPPLLSGQGFSISSAFHLSSLAMIASSEQYILVHVQLAFCMYLKLGTIYMSALCLLHTSLCSHENCSNLYGVCCRC